MSNNTRNLLLGLFCSLSEDTQEPMIQTPRYRSHDDSATIDAASIPEPAAVLATMMTAQSCAGTIRRLQRLYPCEKRGHPVLHRSLSVSVIPANTSWSVLVLISAPLLTPSQIDNGSSMASRYKMSSEQLAALKRLKACLAEVIPPKTMQVPSSTKKITNCFLLSSQKPYSTDESEFVAYQIVV